MREELDGIEVETEEDLHDRRQMMQTLVGHPGWKELTRIMSEQNLLREQRELAYEIKGPEDLYELVQLKAERRAFKLILSLPETIIETTTEDLKEIEDESSE